MTKYYYNQTDSRWANKMYSSTNNTNQTIKTSGCGPTAGAMVISAFEEVILPDKMADLFVANGFRSANDGTYWSAFKWLAERWNIGFEQSNSVEKAIEYVKNGGIAVVAIGNGLFTTNGHLLVIAGIDGNNLLIYDPYLYNGKFNSSSRQGKVTVSGTNVYCSIDNFKNYANAIQYFCYKGKTNSNAVNQGKTGQIKTFNKATTIYEKSNLTGIQYSYLANTTVEILENLGTTDKVKAKATNRVGYVYNVGLYKEGSSTNNKSTVGQIKIFKKATTVYEKSNLTGIQYSYLANTTVEILENLGTTDKIKSRVTGRIGYVPNNVYQ